MSQLPGPLTRGRLIEPRARATFIAEHIRRSHELADRLVRISAEDADVDYRRWRDYNERLLQLLLEDLKAEIRELESVLEYLRLPDFGPESPSLTASEPAAGKVMVVYGRNEEAKEKVARFLMKLGLEPILLDEQAARGQTLIEKLEAQTPVTFAIVLLTGDDIGAFASTLGDIRSRARQNVIFELGYAIAKLSRERVCALYEEGVELPSDFRGVEYKLLDPGGAWKSKLAKELHEAGLRFDPLKVL